MLELKKIRVANKCTQQKLADKLNVSRSTVAMWEKGDSEPNTDTLTAISEFFNVSVDYLLGKEEKTPTIDEQMNDIEFALYGEVKDLTDEQKQEILDFVKFKKLQEKFGEK